MGFEPTRLCSDLRLSPMVQFPARPPRLACLPIPPQGLTSSLPTLDSLRRSVFGHSIPGVESGILDCHACDRRQTASSYSVSCQPWPVRLRAPATLDGLLSAG